MISDGKQIVLTREELVAALFATVDDPVDVGKITGFISRAFALQNDIGRPAYVFEVEKSITKEDVEYLQGALQELGVCAVLVPKGILEYVCTVTPKSMGAQNVKTVLWHLDDRKKE